MGTFLFFSPSRRAKLIACFATVYLVWGSTYAVVRIGVHELPPLLFGGIRFLCAGLLLGITPLLLGNRFAIDRTEWKHLLIVAIGSVAIANGATNIAMQHVASNTTAIINASAALWIALLATRGRRAHALDRWTSSGLVIGFAGTLLIIWPHGDVSIGHLGYQLLILVAVFSWSAATVYIRNAHSKLDVLSFTAVQMTLGGLLLTTAGISVGELADWRWSKTGLVAMGYLTLLSSCIAYTAFAWLAKNSTPAMVGTYSYVNPAIAAVLGWWLLGERLGVHQLIGMAVIFAGVALVSWPLRRTSAAAHASKDSSPVD